MESEDLFAKYHKIQSIFKRNMDCPKKSFHMDKFSKPEFEYLQNNMWEFTEKVDGTNVRVAWDGEGFKFGGRTDNAQMPMPLIDALQAMFVVKAFKDEFGSAPITVYGEGYGGKIQKGSKYNPVQTFVCFDIRIEGWWMRREDVDGICERLGIKSVPILGVGALQEGIDLVQSGLISAWGDFEAEGIVARPTLELEGRNGGRIITKIKARDFK